MQNKDNCKLTNTTNIFNFVLQDKAKLKLIRSPLMYTITFSLFYRCFDFIGDITTNKRKHYLYAYIAAYLASNLVDANPGYRSELDRILNETALKGLCKKDEFLSETKKLVVNLKGVIRVPTIYDVTNNGLEVAWWIKKVTTDCTYLEKSPKECHDQYSLIETQNQDLFQYRIPLHLINEMGFVPGSALKYNSYPDYCYIEYYPTFEHYLSNKRHQTKTLKFDWDQSGLPINFKSR
jgi:hypothetical protein